MIIIMAAISRRELIAPAAVCCGVGGIMLANSAESSANPLGLPIGCQVWPLRSMLKEFPTFVRTIAGIGVTRLELCSPLGYGSEFASLANAKEVKQVLADHGLKAESSHFTMGELRKSQEQSIAWAK